jgi:hypothetical protein
VDWGMLLAYLNIMADKVYIKWVDSR